MPVSIGTKVQRYFEIDGWGRVRKYCPIKSKIVQWRRVCNNAGRDGTSRSSNKGTGKRAGVRVEEIGKLL